MPRKLMPVLGLLLPAVLILLNASPAPIEAEPASEPAADTARNPIDVFVLKRLEAEKIEASPLCTDEEFARRIYLDICGVIPTRGQLKEFLADRTGNKREKLIDTLLKSPRYAQAWSVLWGDLLREHSNSKQAEGTEQGSYRDWIRASLGQNMPYDQFVRALITASGSPEDNGAVNFYLRDEQSRVESANTVATVFMGTRMGCAQCHDHPFDKWTQQDFHSLMSFFGRVSVIDNPVTTLLKLESDQKYLNDEAKKVLEPYFKEAHAAEQKMAGAANRTDSAAMVLGAPVVVPLLDKARIVNKEIRNGASKEAALLMRQGLNRHQGHQVVEHPTGDYRMPSEGDSASKNGQNSGDIVPAVFPWEITLKFSAAGSRRKALADFVTGSRQFAAVQVNRLWAAVMGRGLVDPVDDFREKNPPSHPELLDYLTDEFIKSGFDNQHILRLIFNSNTYQRSTQPTPSNRGDTALYSHMRLRRMSAEQIFDSILVATGHEQGLKDMKINLRTLALHPIYADRNPRMTGTKQEVLWAADLPTPARAGSFMSLFNQPDRDQTAVKRDESGSIGQALELMNGSTLNDAVSSSPTSAELMNAKAGTRQIVTELYLATLSRHPSEQELQFLCSGVSGAVTREWIDDACWALLNSREFGFIK